MSKNHLSDAVRDEIFLTKFVGFRRFPDGKLFVSCRSTSTIAAIVNFRKALIVGYEWRGETATENVQHEGITEKQLWSQVDGIKSAEEERRAK